ncbi:MAG: hypothetical protein ACR2RE_09430 [Geminicoccaceae bacterium]
MYLTADFGAANAGIGTVGYTLKNAAGGDAVARTTTGVTDLGNGAYGVEVDLPPTAVAVKWDTGGGSPLFAHESLIDAQSNIFLRNRNEVNQSGTPRQTIYRDDGTTVYMEGGAFQDQAGATPYAGNGVERRERLD